VATDNDFKFPNPIGLSLPSNDLFKTLVYSEWYVAESDVGGRDVARKNIWRGPTFQILKHP